MKESSDCPFKSSLPPLTRTRRIVNVFGLIRTYLKENGILQQQVSPIHTNGEIGQSMASVLEIHRYVYHVLPFSLHKNKNVIDYTVLYVLYIVFSACKYIARRLIDGFFSWRLPPLKGPRAWQGGHGQKTKGHAFTSHSNQPRPVHSQ